jgi:acyl-CoA thioester hydrolase
VIHQRILRGQNPIAEATVTAAFIGPDGRPKRQPREWASKFRSLISTVPAGSET